MTAARALLGLALLACVAGAAAQECWGAVAESHHYQLQGTCVKGTKNGEYCSAQVQGYTVRDSYPSLAACCSETAGKMKINGMDGRPRARTYQFVADTCISGKTDSAPDKASKYVEFKGTDLGAQVDIANLRAPDMPQYWKVCGGKDAVAKACAEISCGAYTFGGDGDCGYLKFQYYQGGASPALLFKPNAKWSTYVADYLLPKAQGGSVDCAAMPWFTPCKVKFPSAGGSPSAPPAASSNDCWAHEAESHHAQRAGAWGSQGGCLKGTKSGDSCSVKTPAGITASGTFPSLAACCAALVPAVKISPMNGEALPGQQNYVADACLAGKSVKINDLNKPNKYIEFKGVDLGSEVDVPDNRGGNGKWTKVCGGKEAIKTACKEKGCGAFTFGGDGDCGYLKFQYYQGGASPALLFKPNAKWSTYVADYLLPKAQGGSVDCAAMPWFTPCKVKAAFPAQGGSMAA